MATIPDHMHHLDLSLFNYQVSYIRELLKDLCDQVTVDELGLNAYETVYPHIKVFIFIIEEIITKHHKESLSENQAKKADKALVNVFYY